MSLLRQMQTVKKTTALAAVPATLGRWGGKKPPLTSKSLILLIIKSGTPFAFYSASRPTAM
jgi:hypothetical protein